MASKSGLVVPQRELLDISISSITSGHDADLSRSAFDAIMSAGKFRSDHDSTRYLSFRVAMSSSRRMSSCEGSVAVLFLDEWLVSNSRIVTYSVSHLST